MRKFCHLLCVGLNLACGSSVAASPTNSIPFDFSEGLLWVQVESPQAKRPLNFLFDTGAEISVLNADTAAELGLSGGRKIRVQGVDAATTGRWPVQLAARTGTVELPSKYLSLDLSRLSASCKRPLDGLLGTDFVRGKTMEIDFELHLIRFVDRYCPAKMGIELPLKTSSLCFCAPVSINGGQKEWLRIDTGCATALQWAPDAAVHTDAVRPAIGLSGLSIPQTQTTVSFGEARFEQVPTGIHRQPIFAGESGLLGNGLLARFKTVTIDTKHKRLVLVPM